ncbi:Uncharacterised protein [Mycobacterium tuberculosis]|uniref:Uncharacterized protein n=1 Tax=Mycobacterium tuberculosis TaxID=1773 RepID=A0A654TS14_MYCTX|nr:Uncharacterised protein [Mycobacterium tuberculosis]CFS31535.1 Uncharacterised protein [Mycobacterium tuberculosis]CKP48806.1 Uncharacterised protein [Mycobacterium tuberculosis]CKQ14022.1 Uncharacterised protein [Mycobacterium tuberculosis]CKR35622.1 Uncharacterised protein [Mycobacterium tuberculosis]
MLGNATLTMLTSTNTMKMPSPVANTVSRWRGVIAVWESPSTVSGAAVTSDFSGWLPIMRFLLMRSRASRSQELTLGNASMRQ